MCSRVMCSRIVQRRRRGALAGTHRRRAGGSHRPRAARCADRVLVNSAYHASTSRRTAERPQVVLRRVGPRSRRPVPRRHLGPRSHPACVGPDGPRLSAIRQTICHLADNCLGAACRVVLRRRPGGAGPSDRGRGRPGRMPAVSPSGEKQALRRSDRVFRASSPESCIGPTSAAHRAESAGVSPARTLAAGPPRHRPRRRQHPEHPDSH